MSPADFGALTLATNVAQIGAANDNARHGPTPTPGCLLDAWLIEPADLRQPLRADEPAYGAGAGDDTIALSWADLERELVRFAASPQLARFAREIIRSTRRTAPHKPMDVVVREILCITSIVMDEGFAGDSDWDPRCSTPLA